MSHGCWVESIWVIRYRWRKWIIHVQAIFKSHSNQKHYCPWQPCWICNRHQRQTFVNYNHSMNSPVNFDSNRHMKMIFKSVLFAYSVKLYISHKIGYNFESSQPKGHSGQLWLKLVQWFQRRRYLKTEAPRSL